MPALFRLAAPLALILIAATGVTPHPNAMHRFGVWAAGCDNTLTCEIVGPTAKGPNGTIRIVLSRRANGDSPFDISYEGDAAEAVEIIDVDGKRVSYPEPGMTSQATNATITRLLRKGRWLAVTDAAGHVLTTVALRDAAAAIGYVDGVQGRAGTDTAIVQNGTAPAIAIPRAPRRPHIKAPALARRSAAVAPATRKRLARLTGCTFAGNAHIDAFHLDHGRILAAVPCGRGEYGALYAMALIRGMTINPLPVDAPFLFVPNADRAFRRMYYGGYDHGAIVTFAERAGAIDCGGKQTYDWDGAQFRLTQQLYTIACGGDDHSVETWRVDVERS